MDEIVDVIREGTRVRGTLQSAANKALGTVMTNVADDDIPEYPYLILWDHGGEERCARGEIEVVQ
jgi:hypothetical protein